MFKYFNLSANAVILLVPLVASQSQQTFPAPTIYGDDLWCTEPAHRFESSIKRKLDHNQDYPANPEQWICQFCDNELQQVVNRICCGENQRKRREAQELEFWHGISHQNSKLMSKIENGQYFHPNSQIHKHLNADCLEDFEKNGHSVTKRAVDETTENLSPGQKKKIWLQKKKAKEEKQRLKANENTSQVLNWKNSIENGGKGRSQIEELTALDKITCHKKISNNFLGSGKTYDRRIWKHTYIQRECCGIGVGSKNNCDLDEIQDSYLQEECCHEGCRVEEIYEDCGAWRWDMKEFAEEIL